MEVYQVIFNGVPISKSNPAWETIYLPRWITFKVKNQIDLYEKIDNYIIETGIRFSSYEIDLIK